MWDDIKKIKSNHIGIAIIFILLFLGICTIIYLKEQTNVRYEKDLDIYGKTEVPFQGKISLTNIKPASVWVKEIYEIDYTTTKPVKITVVTITDNEFDSGIMFSHIFENETAKIYLPYIQPGDYKIYVSHNNTFEQSWVGPVWTS